jgi:outer membrane protein OmpA-like peptidoglycan-associated protein
MKLAWILFLLFNGYGICAQNLVANGSFEDINICTEFKSPCSPKAWFALRRISSYGYAQLNDIPAPDGNYCLRFSVANRGGTQRQYWETMLLCPLQPGETYTIGIKAASALIGPNLNDIGFYFTDSLIFAREDSLLQPDNYFDFFGGTIERLHNGWFALKKEIKATQKKQFLIIGNFSKLSNQDIILKRRLSTYVNINLQIDDVVVSPVKKTACPDMQRMKDSLYSILERHTRNGLVDSPPLLKVPPVVPPPPQAIDTVQINNVQFRFDSYILNNPDTLDMLKKFLVNRDIEKIKVIGFTDDAGTEAYNSVLSIKRAREIGRLISIKFDIPASQIETEGRGISTRYKEKEQNRRVEIYIYHQR